jgi:multidrug efflux pump subunit AcrA (membrane-fusion protein)
MSQNQSKWWAVVLVVIVALGVGAVGGFLIAGKSPGPNQTAVDQTVGGKQLYSCGMHPDIIRDQPGNCPICGMKLTPVKTASAAAAVPSGERKIKYWRAPMDPTYISDKPGKSPMGMDLVPVYEDQIEAGAIVIDPVTVQNMGLRTAQVKTGRLTRTIRTVANVTYDERKLYAINTKIDGWIEKLHVNETGQEVEEGQPLLEIYSPDLVSTQEEYLSAAKNYQSLKDSPYQDVREGALELLNSTRRRLEYWGIDEDQIRNLESGGGMRKTLTLNSPAQGVVVHKDAVEGTYVKAGSNLFRIADLSTVWVQAAVYEYELPYLKLGQTARVSLPYLPGESFQGKVTYIYPYLDAKARDVKVRLEFSNPVLKLKPEMYADVVIESELPGDRVLVPEEAVIRSGKREIVFVDLGEGKFAPREIVTGVSGEGDVVEVKNGLLPGEIIVASGQFMLDSESKTQEAIRKMIQVQSPASSAAQTQVPSGSDSAKQRETPKAEAAAVKNLNLTPDMKADFSDQVYTCPMAEHSHVLQVGPGTCPECGMKLVPITQTGRRVYTCPMPEHHHILSDRPGECPECGMKLIELKPEQDAAGEGGGK